MSEPDVNAQHMRAMGVDPAMLGRVRAPNNLHRIVRQKAYSILSQQPLLVEDGTEAWAKRMGDQIADAVMGAVDA